MSKRGQQKTSRQSRASFRVVVLSSSILALTLAHSPRSRASSALQGSNGQWPAPMDKIPMYNGLELPDTPNANAAAGEAVVEAEEGGGVAAVVDIEAARGKAPDGHGPSSFVHTLLASSIG